MTKLDMKTFLCHLWLIGSLLVLFAPSAYAASRQFTLYKGEVKVLKLGPIERVAIGDGNIVSTTVLKTGQLVVLAGKNGVSDMHIWLKNGRQYAYRVTVLPGAMLATGTKIGELLDKIPGVKLTTIGGKMLVEGDVDPEKKKLISTLVSQFPDLVDLTVVKSVPSTRMISMLVQIVEISTNALDNLGIDWNSPINGPAAGVVAPGVSNAYSTLASPDGLTLPNGLDGAFFGIATGLTSSINLLAQSGQAYLLAEPRLSTKSGGTATFLAGGEVPIPVTSGLGSTNVIFKKYGIQLKIKPVTDDKGNILAHVETEVSDVNPNQTVQGIPGFLTRSASTDISMHEGQTMVISGLINQNTGESVTGIPGLRDIPILGALFRSKTFQNKESELVIFVTPRIYGADSELNKRALARMQKLQKRFTKNIDDQLMD
ncbi:MAG: pilus assembly protein N-terminal domain-containing protein [Gammaproteobacteria bacterium]